jgi:Xaa-Pro dipeptidase
MPSSRFDRLDTALKGESLDAVALAPGATLTWLSGLHFHLMERPVVMLFARGQNPAIILPELETPKLSALSFPVQAFAYGEDPAAWDEVFRRAVDSLGLEGKKIGVEPHALRLLEFNHIRAGARQADFPDASGALASLRLIKEADEISRMRAAVKIAQDSLEATLPLIRIGMTEAELANELVVQILRHGSQPDMPFSPIVSAGPNSANPHATPTDRQLHAGDLLVFDWGATHMGYMSDLTRTFAVGEVDAEYRKIHEIVLASNAAGRAAGGPGIPCAEVDRASRGVIEGAGYGKYFTHRTGHGLGMEAHEEPYMRGDNMELLKVGMAYTVEPGIYLPNRNGVRIEDNMVVTEAGAESLSDIPREIRPVG